MRPSTIEIITRLLGFANVQADPQVIAAKAVEVIDSGGRDRDFFRWCKTEYPAFQALSHDWLQTFWWAAWRIQYAERDAKKLGEEWLQLAFPFRYIDSYACSVDGHSELDQFCALLRDPIWLDMEEPFGWNCSCSVLCILSSDPQVTSDAAVPGHARLSPLTIERAKRWLDFPPFKI